MLLLEIPGGLGLVCVPAGDPRQVWFVLLLEIPGSFGLVWFVLLLEIPGRFGLVCVVAEDPRWAWFGLCYTAWRFQVGLVWFVLFLSLHFEMLQEIYHLPNIFIFLFVVRIQLLQLTV